jgi:tRNA threonylcarbamoyladenosine biosynthesis protein TsaE
MKKILIDEAAQEDFGARLAAACGRSALIFLEGDLGAGKTTLTRGLINAMGHRGAVKSPTYTLIEPYDIDEKRVYHLDLYRVTDPGELEYLGLRELLAEDALVLIEWAERGERWLPAPDLRVRIRHLPEGRELECGAMTEKGGEILAGLGCNL